MRLFADRYARILMAPDDGGAPPAAEPGPGADAAAAGPETTGTPPTAAASPPALATGAAPPAPSPASPPAATATDFPADWRERMAGDDTGLLNTLKRYATPAAVADWLRKTQLKVSSGELRSVLPKDATPEQVAEYRKANGIPTEAKAYADALKLPEGMVAGEQDQPLIASFAEKAHALNLDQKSFDSVVSWWFETQNQLQQERVGLDNDFRLQAEQRLIKEMGADFEPNMRAIGSFWREFGNDAIMTTVLSARTADGQVLGNIPEFNIFLAGLARELNPAAAALPSGSAGTPQAVETRMREIEGKMYVGGKPNPEYFGGPMEAEYRQLIAAQERMKERAA